MPLYDYQCRECDHRWDTFRPMQERSDPIECPACGVVGDHRAITAPALHIEGSKPPSEQSFSYRLGKNMDDARRTRAEHEAKFGKYEEFTGPRKGAPRRVIPEEDIDFIGDADPQTFRDVMNNEHQS